MPHTRCVLVQAVITAMRPLIWAHSNPEIGIMINLTWQMRKSKLKLMKLLHHDATPCHSDATLSPQWAASSSEEPAWMHQVAVLLSQLCYYQLGNCEKLRGKEVQMVSLSAFFLFLTSWISKKSRALSPSCCSFGIATVWTTHAHCALHMSVDTPLLPQRGTGDLR